MKVAVIGVGSIGSRHAANLRTLGVDVVTVDPVLEADYREFAGVPDVDAAVIATPAGSHIALAAAALERGCDVFIEKPIAVSLANLQHLERMVPRDAVLQVGYNLRFRPDLVLLRDRMQRDRPLYVRMEFGQRLTEWRPGRDYRETPTAKPHREGGGILLEASHELDLMLWMFGNWPALYGVVRTLSELAPTCDYAGAVVDYGDLIVEVSLNMIASGYRRFIRAVHVDGEVSEWNYTDDAGASYLEEMRHFISCIQTREKPRVGLLEGYRTLELVEAILTSKERGGNIFHNGVGFREPIWSRQLVAN